MNKLSILPLLVLTACADPSSRVQIGMNQGQVETILGEPHSVNREGKQVRHQYRRQRLFSPAEKLEVIFENGRVVPFEPANQLDEVKKGNAARLQRAIERAKGWSE